MNIPCIHETLRFVRNLIYKLLSIDHVTEYGQRGVHHFTMKEIRVIPCGKHTLFHLQQLPFRQKVITAFNALQNCSYNIDRLNDNSVLKRVLLLSEIRFFDADIGDDDQVKDYFSAALTCMCLLVALNQNIVKDEYVTPLIMACF